MPESLVPVTARDVAEFIGQGDDPAAVALAGEHLPIVTAMARAYTRGNGFSAGLVAEDVAAVLVAATARLMANPDQTQYKAGNVSFQSFFRGWSLAETFVLNRYRRTAQ